MRAFTVYVHPILEYMLRAFGPHIRWGKSSKLNLLKEVSSDGCYHTCIDYKTRLLRLGVDSLKFKRLRQDLIYTYKIVFGQVPNAGIEFSH